MRSPPYAIRTGWISGTKVVPGNSTTGLVSSRYLGFGVSQIPRRHRQFAFPPIPTGTPSRLTALARLGSLLRSVRPPGTNPESTPTSRSGQTLSTSTHALLPVLSSREKKSDKTDGGGRMTRALTAQTAKQPDRGRATALTCGSSVVGARGFEPLTSSASRKRSPPELSARASESSRHRSAAAYREQRFKAFNKAQDRVSM